MLASDGSTLDALRDTLMLASPPRDISGSGIYEAPLGCEEMPPSGSSAGAPRDNFSDRDNRLTVEEVLVDKLLIDMLPLRTRVPASSWISPHWRMHLCDVCVLEMGRGGVECGALLPPTRTGRCT